MSRRLLCSLVLLCMTTALPASAQDEAAPTAPPAATAASGSEEVSTEAPATQESDAVASPADSGATPSPASNPPSLPAAAGTIVVDPAATERFEACLAKVKYGSPDGMICLSEVVSSAPETTAALRAQTLLDVMEPGRFVRADPA